MCKLIIANHSTTMVKVANYVLTIKLDETNPFCEEKYATGQALNYNKIMRAKYVSLDSTVFT